MFWAKNKESYFWREKNWSKEEKINGVFQKIGIQEEGLTHENSSEAAELGGKGGHSFI